MQFRFLPSKTIVNSRSTTFKVVMTFCLGLGFLIMSPIFIALAPFFFAWKIIDDMIVVSSIKTQKQVAFPESRWGKFEVDFDGWKKEA